ncbi:MAG: carboxypeptidase-like regulatory domain-containing protein, partial [Muribaculaceae bacterium]
MLLTLCACLPALAQRAGVKGVIVDDANGLPVIGATVLLDNQGNSAVTDIDGRFYIDDAAPGEDNVSVLCLGYNDFTQFVTIKPGKIADLGTLRIKASGFDNSGSDFDLIIDEAMLEDEEGNSQTISTLTGASDNVFYNAANYNFSVMRFRQRGYDQNFNEMYINGVNFNDPARGRFNYSMFGGLNQAFKNKTTGIGLDATSFSLGLVGGATNVNTQAKDYAPGFRANVAYTNSNYYLRAMAMYSTGLSKSGWALTVGAIARYSDQGVQDGTFYNSAGYFLALQKVFNDRHSLALTTFGAPTRRANNNAVFKESCVLTDDYLYNSAWGWQDGKQRSSKVVESFDPTAIINWIWKPKRGTMVNTGVGFRKSFYASSALNWYNAADPRPDYYRYLPSYYDDESTKAFYTDLWQNDESFRQIDWNHLYQTNYLNNDEGKGATYILENRHSNQLN